MRGWEGRELFHLCLTSFCEFSQDLVGCLFVCFVGLCCVLVLGCFVFCFFLGMVLWKFCTQFASVLFESPVVDRLCFALARQCRKKKARRHDRPSRRPSATCRKCKKLKTLTSFSHEQKEVFRVKGSICATKHPKLNGTVVGYLGCRCVPSCPLLHPLAQAGLSHPAIVVAWAGKCPLSFATALRNIATCSRSQPVPQTTTSTLERGNGTRRQQGTEEEDC